MTLVWPFLAIFSPYFRFWWSFWGDSQVLVMIFQKLWYKTQIFAFFFFFAILYKKQTFVSYAKFCHNFWYVLTLMEADGGGLNQDIRQEIGCHFSQKPPRDLKILDFLKNDVGLRVKESFWAYLDWLSRKRTEFDKNLHIFWGENH